MILCLVVRLFSSIVIGTWCTHSKQKLMSLIQRNLKYICFLVHFLSNTRPHHHHYWDFTVEVKTYSDRADPGLPTNLAIVFSQFSRVGVCVYSDILKLFSDLFFNALTKVLSTAMIVSNFQQRSSNFRMFCSYYTLLLFHE